MSNIEEANKYKALGNAAFSAKNFQEAIQHFTKAIELNPNDHVFYSNRSACYASLEDYEKALEDGTKCVSIKPDWAKGYTRKGLAEFYLEKYDDAEKTYQKGLELEPTNDQLKEGLQRVKETKESGGAGGDAGNPFGQQFMQQAFVKLLKNPETAAYFQDKDFMNKFMQIQKNPQMLGMYLNDPKISKAFQVMMSDFTGGADFGADAGASESQGHEGHQHHAGCSHDHSHQEEAKKDDDHPIIEEEPIHKPKYEHKPETKPERKPEPKAEPPKTQASVSPAEAEKNKGNEEYKKKNFDQAIIHYQKAIELDPNEPIFYNNLAAVYVEQKQLDKAVETCDKALEVCSVGHYDYVKKAKVLARKASALTQKGEYAQAVECYQKSLLENTDYKVKEEMKKVEKLRKEQEEKAYINPEISETHRVKGNELYSQGKYPDAIKEYDEAIRRNPTDAKLYANRGTALMKLMEYPTALKDIDRCIELDPNYVKAYAKKGVIYTLLKENHKAIEAYEKGLKVDPNNEECKAGLEKVRYMSMAGGSESKEEQEIRAQRAMNDPEVRAILQDPQTMQLLKDLQEKPRDPTVMAALSDPTVMKKIERLIAAGIIKTG